MRCIIIIFFIRLYTFVSRVTDNLWITLIKRIKLFFFRFVPSHTQLQVSLRCQVGLERFVDLAAMKGVKCKWG